MRQVICDYARERMAQKRGAGERGIPLEEIEVAEVKQAMQLIELRSGHEGHPTYRAVAQAMHDRIASVHPSVAASMTHLDTSSEPRLERMLSEIRTHRKLLAAEGTSKAPPGFSELG